MVDVVGLKMGLGISQIAQGSCIKAFLSIVSKLRNGNGGKNTNDGNDNHQLNERKTGTVNFLRHKDSNAQTKLSASLINANPVPQKSI